MTNQHKLRDQISRQMQTTRTEPFGCRSFVGFSWTTSRNSCKAHPTWNKCSSQTAAGYGSRTASCTTPSPFSNAGLLFADPLECVLSFQRQRCGAFLKPVSPSGSLSLLNSLRTRLRPFELLTMNGVSTVLMLCGKGWAELLSVYRIIGRSTRMTWSV